MDRIITRAPPPRSPHRVIRVDDQCIVISVMLLSEWVTVTQAAVRRRRVTAPPCLDQYLSFCEAVDYLVLPADRQVGSY
jgi:hypothetical protein